MIAHHFKRHFNNSTSFIIYGLLIAYFLISGLQLSTIELSALTVNIGVIDNADNEISQQYIKSLSKHDILRLSKTDFKQGMSLIDREILDLLIIIPQNYSASGTADKLDYYYLKSNVIAPATLDLIAVDLMPQVIENKLIATSKLYQIGDESTAKNDFKSYISSLTDNFTVDILTIDHASQIREEQAIIILNSAKNSLLFALFIIVLVVVLPLSIRLKTDIETRRRLTLSKHGVVRYYLAEHCFSYFYLSLIWCVAVSAITHAIKLNSQLTFFMLLSGSTTIILYYELFRLMLNNAKQGYISSLLALLAAILPAILGGVFFDSNLLPTRLFNLVSILPFNALESAFYGGLSLQGLAINHILLLLVYLGLSLVLLTLNLASAKRIV